MAGEKLIKLIPSLYPDCFLHIDSVPHLHLKINMLFHTHARTHTQKDDRHQQRDLQPGDGGDRSPLTSLSDHLSHDLCRKLKSASSPLVEHQSCFSIWHSFSLTSSRTDMTMLLTRHLDSSRTFQTQGGTGGCQVGGLNSAHPSVDQNLPPRCTLPFPSRAASLLG